MKNLEITLKTTDTLAQLEANLRKLVGQEVLVGYPSDKLEERENQDGSPQAITNAQLAYIHNNGSPTMNIPARPFLEPGVAAKQDQITALMLGAARRATAGEPFAASLAAVGTVAVSGAKGVIQAGISPGLSAGTLAARQRRGRKGHATSDTTPLIDTAQMINALTFVVRKRRT